MEKLNKFYLVMGLLLWMAVGLMTNQKVQAYAPEFEKVQDMLRCEDADKDPNLANDASFRAYVQEMNYPRSLTISLSGGGSFTIFPNLKMARERCILVYGDHNHVERKKPNDQDYNSAIGQYTYLGFSPVTAKYPFQSWEYYAVPNPRYYDYCPSGCGDYIETRPFAERPWKNKNNDPGIKIFDSSIPAKDITYQKSNKYCGDIPSAVQWQTQSLSCVPSNNLTAPGQGAEDLEWQQMLDHAIDPFPPTRSALYANYHGDFQKKNNRLNKVLNGKNLYPHAAMIVRAGKHTFGMFGLYYYSTSSDRWWYRTVMIPPEDCFVNCKEPEQDSSITMNFDETKKWMDTERLTGTITISNKMKDKILIPCSPTGAGPSAKCLNGTDQKGYFTITNKATKAVAVDSKTKASLKKEIQKFKCYTPPTRTECNAKPWATTGIAKATSKTIDLRGEQIYLAAGSYEICATIPKYNKELTPANNSVCESFTVISKEDMKVELNGPDTVIQGESLTHGAEVTNNMNAAKSGTLKIDILKWTGSSWAAVPVKTLSVPYLNIPMDENFTYELYKAAIKLKVGKYKMEARITRDPKEMDYAVTDITKTNNYDSLEFRVTPFVPNNVKCKEIKVDYTKVIGKKNLTKVCIGQMPTYPSTEIEGGQGTFFYIGYRLFPMPLPAYEVTNLDEKGLYQEYVMKEPTDKLASCDYNVVNDTECDIVDTFIYYPTKIGQQNNLKGPYKAGPHSFYHYLYRGRMLPNEVKFDYSILDPSENRLTVSGDVVFKIDKNCYLDTVLDLKEECRQIDFYVPTGNTMPKSLTINTSGLDGRTLIELPQDADKIHFKNPGIHKLNLQVTESQIYRYQADEGAEWQGNGKDKHAASTAPHPDSGYISAGTAKANTNTITNGSKGEKIWQLRDDFKNHCYDNNEAFSESKGEICFHDHDKEYHYWIYKWSTVRDIVGKITP